MAEREPSKRRRAHSAERRDGAILTSARTMFAAKGFENASVSDIASEAGVAVGTIYLRYANKTALLGAVLEAAASGFVAAMEAPGIHARPWSERFEPMFAALLTEAARQPDLPALMRLSLHLPDDPGHARVRGAIEKFMRAGQAAGSFRPVPIGPAAALAYGMVQSAMIEMLTGGATAEELTAVLADASRRWMIGEAGPQE